MNTFVVPHDPKWKSAFDAEARSLSAVASDCELTLHHIGSTAIPGILAKPIIDLLGVVADLDQLDACSEMIEILGYEAMGEFGIDGRRYFRKVDNGTRTHHLHVFAKGSPHIERHLAFRDYLRHHSDVAAKYSDLKASLTREKPATWSGYVDGKAPFVESVEKDAVLWFRQMRVKVG